MMCNESGAFLGGDVAPWRHVTEAPRGRGDGAEFAAVHAAVASGRVRSDGPRNRSVASLSPTLEPVTRPARDENEIPAVHHERWVAQAELQFTVGT
jgi:hypothetical protein